MSENESWDEYRLLILAHQKEIMAGMKEYNTELKSIGKDIVGLSTQYSGLDTRVSKIETDISNINTKIDKGAISTSVLKTKVAVFSFLGGCVIAGIFQIVLKLI